MRTDDDLKPSRGPVVRAVSALARAFGWGVVAGACGIGLGLLNGVLSAPPDVPGDGLANEWYTPAVFLFALLEGLLAFLFAAALALLVPRPRDRSRAVLSSILGAILGLGLGAVVVLGRMVTGPDFEAARLPFSLVLQAVGAAFGMAYALRNVAKPPDAHLE